MKALVVPRRPPPSLLAAALSAALPPAWPAGGHFDVDDAAMVEPGRCQVETWWLRAPAAVTTLLHLGPACRVGPLELGLNLDRVAATGETTRTWLGPAL